MSKESDLQGENKHSDMSEQLTSLPHDELLGKVKTLIVQMRKAVEDFYNRMDVFHEHDKIIRELIQENKFMNDEWEKGNTNATFEHGSNINKLKSKLEKESSVMYKNMMIIHNNKEIILKFEEDIKIYEEAIHKKSLSEYTDIDKKTQSVGGIVETRIDNIKKNLLKEEEEEARLVALTVEIMRLVSLLDSYLQQINAKIKHQLTIIERIEIKKGVTPDFMTIEDMLRQLLQSHRELLSLLEDEKKRIHQRVLRLIGEQTHSIDQANELVAQRRSALSGENAKVTVDDIKRYIRRFPNVQEALIFASTIYSLAGSELDDETEVELKKVFSGVYEKNYQLSQSAKLDELTQIPNRRSSDKEFLKIITIEYNNQQKLINKETVFDDFKGFVVCLIDIDKFKIVNDVYGHIKGDEILKGVSRFLSEKIKEKDYVARWGGEEFVIFFRDITVKEIRKRFEAILIELEKITQAISDKGEEIKITLSAGMIHFSPKDVYDIVNEKGSYESAMLYMVKEIDGLLYNAKEDGRNRAWIRDYSRTKIFMSKGTSREKLGYNDTEE